MTCFDLPLKTRLEYQNTIFNDCRKVAFCNSDFEMEQRVASNEQRSNSTLPSKQRKMELEFGPVHPDGRKANLTLCGG